jgi:hypothetical protein
MRRALAVWVTTGALTTGCTAILGDFSVGGAADGVGDGGGGGEDGPTGDAGAGDGAVGDAAPDVVGTLTCGFIQSSFRKVVDNSANAGVPYQEVRIFTVSDSSARVVPRFNGPTPPLAYSFRTDRVEAPNLQQGPLGSVDAIIHNKSNQAAPTLDFLVGAFVDDDAGTTGQQFYVYSLVDNQTTPSFTAVTPAGLLSSLDTNNSRATFAALGTSDYFLQLGWQDGAQHFFLGLARASAATKGSVLQPCTATPTGCATLPPSFDSPPYATGSFVYNFGSAVPSPDPTVEYQWPAAATSAGTTRTGLGGIFPIALTSLGSGNVQIVGATAQASDAGGVSLALVTASVPEANLFTITTSDFKTVALAGDNDKDPIGQKSGFVSYPGHAAILGPGSLLTSTGLNFLLVDATTGKIDAFVAGTGKNLLPGNDRVLGVALDYAPTLTAPIAFDVAWIEQVTPDGGSPYEAIYYEKLQCDRR